MKLLIPFLLAAGMAGAQSSDKLEIRGTVVEGGLGVAGATVTLYEFGHTPPEATTRTVFAIASTDPKGEFQLHPVRAGAYYVEVKKEGYFAESFDGPTVEPADSIGDPVSIDKDHPLQERRFTMIRLGELRGRVLDEDGKPLAKLRVALRPTTSTQIITDQDGFFVATKLRPGDYLVAIVPQQGSLQILPQFSQSDLKIVDQDMAISFWPGGGDERAASPMPVRAGASLSVGNIVARKASYYRAHLVIQSAAKSADCAPGEKWTFRVIPAGDTSGFVLPLTVPCGKEFLVRNLSPGSYSFQLLSGGRSAESKQWGITPVEVKDKNLEVAMTVSPLADINGRLVAPDGVAVPALGKLTIEVRPVITSPIGSQIGMPDQAGKFLIHGLAGDRHQVLVNGLGNGFYIKEIRYNGLVAADGFITPVAGPTILEILIDDHASTISGSVVGVDRPGARIMVVAAKWPLPAEDASPATLFGANASAWVDDQGRFKIGGLAPGEYRVFVMTDDLRIRLRGDALTQLVSRSEKVTLERGSSQSISLKIVEP